MRVELDLSYREVIEGWRSDDIFRASFCQQLIQAPFEAYRWETRPVTDANADRPFEFVFIRCDPLERSSDRNAFAEHFDDAHVVTFDNLGGDATLIVPCPVVADDAYAHLGAFMRAAPDTQQRALWVAVGEAMTRRLGTKPVWLSTAGMGVAWLHVRLDDRPKYYAHAPYRHVPSERGGRSR